MANGDLCIHCDMQETTHKHPEYAAEGCVPCGNFESPVKHDPDCPVVGCYGNCEVTLKQRDWEATCAEARLRNSWYMDPKTGNIVVIDLNT